MARTRKVWVVRSRPCGYTVESRLTGEIADTCYQSRDAAIAEAARRNSIA